MTVTEFALLKLRDRYDRLDFLETVMQYQEVQDSWVRRNQPTTTTLPATGVSSMFIETSPANPPSLLITAPWDSPAAHAEWVRSKDNQVVFAKLSQVIAPGCGSTKLVHLEPAGSQEVLSEDFLTLERFHVCYVLVQPKDKGTLQDRYQKLEGELRGEKAKQQIWAGWNVEKQGSIDELIVFWSDKVAEGRLRPLTSLAQETHRRSFQPVVK